MEKQRIKSAGKFRKRLLAVLLILSGIQLYAQTLPQTFVPVDDSKLHTKEDIRFSVVLPNIKASQIQINSPLEKDNVAFKNLRKTEASLQDEGITSGTKIDIWFSFEKKGTYQLPPLSISVSGKKRQIKFEKVTIRENPANMMPRVVLIFSNGDERYSDEPVDQKIKAVAGQKLSFTVYLQYSSQLIQFSWDIPKNAIFQQTESFEITEIKYREKKYSDELIPVASFEWISLTRGIEEFPKIKLTATSYDGYKCDILLPQILVDFSEGGKSDGQTAGAEAYDSAFDEAFDFGKMNGDENQSKEILTEDCKKLAALRSQEKKAILRNKIFVIQRSAFEESLGLPEGEKEFCSAWVFRALTVLILLFFILILFIKRRNLTNIIITGCLIICALVFLGFSITQSRKTYGIFTGGSLYSVPEVLASAKSELSAGNRVHILEETTDWYFIEIGETSGWVGKNSIVVIKG